MNKRLRKKLHRGEYTVYGFHIEFTTTARFDFGGPGLHGPGVVFSERLDEWAHARGWCCAPGGNGQRWGAFVVPDRENRPRRGLTEADRTAILEHVESLAEVDRRDH